MDSSTQAQPTDAPASGGPARLRIALVITELEVGGAERALVRLACGLDPAVFDVRVCSIAPLPSAGNSLLAELAARNVSVSSIDARHQRQIAGALVRLRRWLKTSEPDLVQSFLFHANLLVGLARPQRMPHVLGVRVADPRRGRLLAEWLTARRAHGVVAVSEGVATHLARHGFDPQRITTIANGIDVERWSAACPVDTQTFGISRQRRLLLGIGRLDEQKGFAWLLSQAPEILAQLPDHDLVILGEGPQRTALERLAETAPPGRVHLLGWQQDIAGWLARCDLLLLTSRYEGMPNAVLEAMAAGRAVVAYRVEGVAELLGPETQRQSAPSDRPDAFLSLLLALARDTQLRNQCARANQQRAGDEFSTARMVARYATLYRTLLGGH